LAIVCPPRPVGQWTDLSNFRQLKSRTLAERTRCVGVLAIQSRKSSTHMDGQDTQDEKPEGISCISCLSIFEILSDSKN
jgi:hypothetical protein